MENLDDHPEQFSDATRQALERALQGLIEGLQRHGAQVAALPGGTRSTHAVLDANEAVTVVMAAWAEAVSDHTGTWPVPLHLDDGEDEGEADDDARVQVSDGDAVSVVERWDLVVTDVDALLTAGREAHVRTWENEAIEDAVVAVDTPEMALYTLGHEDGPTWLDLPGTELVSGTRLFVRPDGTTPGPGEPEVGTVTQPDGDVLLSETWA